MIRAILVGLLCVCLPNAALAEKRLALIIGNDAYTEVPALRKAVSDADAVAQALAGQGYEVVKAIDATRRQMNRRISEFTGRLERGDTAFVFFAGHGVEIDGENYLLPTDIIAPMRVNVTSSSRNPSPCQACSTGCAQLAHAPRLR